MAATVLLLGVSFSGALPGQPGTASAQAQSIPLGSVVATITGLNLREQPAANAGLVVALPVNARLIVIGGPFNDVWYWLDYNGTKGYASGRFLVLVDENWTPVASPTNTPVVSATPTGATATPTAIGTPSGSATATPPGPVSTTVAQATPTPNYTVPTVPGDYTGLWLGEMAVAGNVRSGPGLDRTIVKGWWVGRRVLLYESATDAKGGIWYRVSEPPEDPLWVHSSLIRRVAPVLFEPARFRGHWVNVNLTQQVVTAYDNGVPVMVTLASTGKAKTPTEIGTWKIYWRLPKQTMEGGNLASGDYYKLKDVPFPQYFHLSGESLHGTFWHDNFGRPMSHGCVNLSTPIAGWFYGWANIGTVVYVHN